MCGIVAIISKTQSGFFQTDKTIFLQMLISDMFRGLDSTGCFAVNKHGNLDMIKDVGPSSYFINKPEARPIFDEMIQKHCIMVGHNRKATIGKVVAENAHPFIEGNICLVHNGTLKKHDNLAETEVDSHAICHHINEHGYKSMFQKIDGAYALVWYNAEEKKLYFARNHERPLHYVETDTKIYIASEEKMLDWILDRNSIYKYTVQEVGVDKVYVFDLEEKKLLEEKKPKKANDWKNNQQQQQHNHWGQLALLPNHSRRSLKNSSKHSSRTPLATIETYTSGQEVSVCCVDYKDGAKYTQLILETMDGLATYANITLAHDKYTQDQITEFQDAYQLKGVISQIVWKQGKAILYLKSVSIDTVWKTRNGTVTQEALKEYGSQCSCCHTALLTPEDVELAEIQTDSAGNVLYAMCEFCSDGYDHIPAYQRRWN